MPALRARRAAAATPLVLSGLLAVLLAPPVSAAAPGSPMPRAAAPDADRHPLAWQLRPTGSDARLRGLDAVSRDVAWASGSGGTVLRTVDGGRSWDSVGPPGTSELQFRDVEAADRNSARILSIGPGSDSRIYATGNGGRTWREVFRNRDEAAFYDCIDFFADNRRGLALSDPVNGKFRILTTADSGLTWHVQSPAVMPPALPGEFAFAASGTCLTSYGGRFAWFATGGGARARVFSSTDAGRTWAVHDTPVRSDEAAGIFSLAFDSPRRGIAVGGDFLAPDEAVRAAARTTNGGESWHLVPRYSAPAGYRSGVDWVPGLADTAIAVGPTGSDVTRDAGRSWRQFDAGSFDSVSCWTRGGCWASGEMGRVGRLVLAQ